MFVVFNLYNETTDHKYLIIIWANNEIESIDIN